MNRTGGDWRLCVRLPISNGMTLQENMPTSKKTKQTFTFTPDTTQPDAFLPIVTFIETNSNWIKGPFGSGRGLSLTRGIKVTVTVEEEGSRL